MNIGGLFVHKLTSYQLALFSACLSCESKHVPAFVLFSGEMLDTGVNRCKIKLFMFCLFCHILPSNYLCGCKFWQKYETKTNKHGQSTNDQQSTNIQKSPNINKYQISTRPGLLLLFFFSVALFCCTRSYIGPRFLELTSRIITWVKWSRLPPAFVWIIEWRLWIGLYFGLSPFMKGTCFVGEWYLFPSATD